jgi:triacylglycerol lipase
MRSILTVVMTVLSFGGASCGSGGTPGSDGGLDGGLDGDEDTCSPACGAPNTECQEGRCVCVPGFHDGGDGACVPEGTCAPQFGIPPGGGDCLPLDEVCVPTESCTQATGWSPEGCEYGLMPDGTGCQGDSPDPCVTHFECHSGVCEAVPPGCTLLRPVVFVHGINGGPANFDTMAGRMADSGWPVEYLFFFEAEDPSWGCNVDNAEMIRQLVESVQAQTCQPRVDIVAHSMGTISSRYYIKNLGGVDEVNTYVTLGGQHHGLVEPCWAPDFLNVCVWQELCETGDFIAQLNEDPATPGDLHWVSMYGTADTTVPNESSFLEGAENIEFEGVEHDGPNGLVEVEEVFLEVLRVLQYPCW